jgi:predicted ATPase
VVLAHAEETIALSEENGLTPWLNLGQFHRGWTLAELGQLEHGITEMEVAIDGIRHVGAPLLQYRIAVLAHSYAQAGQTEKGLTMMNKALQHIERSGEKDEHAEMLRLKGEMLLMHDTSVAAPAENCFRAAIGVVRMQEAKWWELRAAIPRTPAVRY